MQPTYVVHSMYLEPTVAKLHSKDGKGNLSFLIPYSTRWRQFLLLCLTGLETSGTKEERAATVPASSTRASRRSARGARCRRAALPSSAEPVRPVRTILEVAFRDQHGTLCTSIFYFDTQCAEKKSCFLNQT